MKTIRSFLTSGQMEGNQQVEEELETLHTQQVEQEQEMMAEEQEQFQSMEEEELEDQAEQSSCVKQSHPTAQLSLLPPAHISLPQDYNIAVAGGQSQRGTRSYPHYCLDANPSLEDFRLHLQGLDGGRKSERDARQVAMDVAKYLYFANSHEINWGTLVDLEAIKAYIRELKNNGVGVEGQLTKLDRFSMALAFTKLHSNQLSWPVIDHANDRLKTWRQSLRKARPLLQFERDEHHAEEELDVSVLDDLNSDELLAELDEVTRKAERNMHLSSQEVDLMVAFLFATMVYKNSQRPGPILNATIAEFAKGVKHEADGNNYFIMKSGVHKTGATYGPAKVVVANQDIHYLQCYINYIRPKLAKKSAGDDSLLLTHSGTRIKNYRALLNKLEKYVGKLPNPTHVRRAVSVLVAGSQTPSEMEAVAKHIGHSVNTAFKYYKARRGNDDAAASYSIIAETTGKYSFFVAYCSWQLSVKIRMQR